ncbi:MAG: type I-G CRISPR-associated RAMP protein Csb1/Cas7g [Betaproteobacteria bacterium]
MSLDLKSFHTIVNEDAALRGRATLQPIGDDGDKVFPPTHAVEVNKLRAEDRPGAKYAWEKRRIKGEERDCVLLDSVQSQANRMEEALQRLWLAKRIALPVIRINFDAKYRDLNAITSLTAPHRIADALLRDSMLENTLFRHSGLGKCFIGSTLADVSGLFKTCPTALLFGLWDSTGPTGTGLRIARNLTSEITGVGAIRGKKTASRIDPAGIEKASGVLYLAKDADEQWTLDRAKAVLKEKKKPSDPDEYVLYKKEGKPSSAIHGNVAPSLDPVAGGVTMDHANQIVVLSLSGLRRLAFGGSDDDDQKARSVLAALGLVALLEAVENPGYFLRSRCQLSPKEGKHLAFKRIAKNGVEEVIDVSRGDAMNLYEAAVEALPDRLTWHPWDSEAKKWSGEKLQKGEAIAKLEPAPKLMALIDKSRELGIAVEDEDTSPEAGAAG